MYAFNDHASSFSRLELTETNIKNVYSFQDLLLFESCPCGKDQTKSWDQTGILAGHLPLVWMRSSKYRHEGMHRKLPLLLLLAWSA